MGSIPEWVLIIGSLINLVFFAGVFYAINKAKNSKVDNHDDKINELSEKVDKMATKVNLIESESTSHKNNIHKLREDVGIFQSTTNKRFEKIDKYQTVELMLIDSLCRAGGVDTTMAMGLLKED